VVPGFAGLDRQARLGAVERLDLALFLDQQNQAVRRRADVQTDDGKQLSGERRKVRSRWGCRRSSAQIRCTQPSEMPAAMAIARPVQWIASRAARRRSWPPSA